MSRKTKGPVSTKEKGNKVFTTEDVSFYTSCPIKIAGKPTVTEIKAHCWEMSIVPRKNIEYCSLCTSPFKACCPCVLMNTITSDAIVIKGDCCPWHHEHGRDAKKVIDKKEKISSYLFVKEEEEPRTDGNGDQTAKRLLEAIEKIDEAPITIGVPDEEPGEEIPLDKIKPVIIKPEKEVMIDVDLIDPDPKQPRTTFRQFYLVKLARSIKTEGQRTAIEVEKKEGGRYLLRDGERRWRAHKIAKLKKIRAIIRPAAGNKKRFVASVVLNFGKEEHTAIEAMKAIIRLYDEFRYNTYQIADLLAKSQSWVYTRLQLRELHPELLIYLDPEKNDGKEKLSVSTAYDLVARVKDKKEQFIIAKQIIEAGMKTTVARFFIQNQCRKRGLEITRGKSGRKPSDDYVLLQNFIERTTQTLDSYLDMGEEQLIKLYKFRSIEDKNNTINVLESIKGRIEDLIDRIR